MNILDMPFPSRTRFARELREVRRIYRHREIRISKTYNQFCIMKAATRFGYTTYQELFLLIRHLDGSKQS